MTKREITTYQSPYIERGQLKKEPIFQNGFFYIGYLYLAPNTKIKKHQHNFFKDLYLLNDVCLLGNEHDLENISSETLKVIYIRYESSNTTKQNLLKRNIDKLHSKLVENGKAEKESIFQDTLFSIHYLYLEPGTKISKHKHLLFNELYLLKVDDSFICLNGEKYDLYNSSEDNMKVICVRY